jgi:hypothetical protein
MGMHPPHGEKQLEEHVCIGIYVWLRTSVCVHTGSGKYERRWENKERTACKVGEKAGIFGALYNCALSAHVLCVNLVADL